MAETNTLSKLHRPSNVDDEHGVAEANRTLRILVTIFPRILPEVFREMLTNFDGDSCLHIVVEQLLKHQDKWVRGRWKVPTRENILMLGSDRDIVPISECFRLDSYKRAVRLALYQEFKTLSKITVDAVMAEHNHSYTRSRSTLEGIAAKSWRQNISKIFATWRRSERNVLEPHPMVRWTLSGEGANAKIPELKKTGSVELDRELNQTVLIPLIEDLKAKQISEDQRQKVRKLYTSVNAAFRTPRSSKWRHVPLAGTSSAFAVSVRLSVKPFLVKVGAEILITRAAKSSVLHRCQQKAVRVAFRDTLLIMLSPNLKGVRSKFTGWNRVWQTEHFSNPRFP
ncbi:hypothetical protein MMC29_000749 [Sticta canariensis]|nr:hypothetical protein [Sticta canariensis]